MASPPTSDGSDTSTSDAPGSTSTVMTTTTTAGTTVTTTTVVAPGSVEPVDDGYGCHAHWAWKSRMKGRLSIGFSKSHVELGDDTEGHQKSFVARLNGRRGWSLEFELAKLSLDGGDTAKTGEASIVKTFGRHHVAPYLLAGIGGGRYQYADGTDQRVHFAEAGGGVMLRGRHFSVGLDVRRGRHFVDRDEMTIARSTTTSDDNDRYTRGRILALFTF